jgi:serine/threonine-protein kinase RsbW
MQPQASVVEVALESTLKNVEIAEEVARCVSATAGFNGEDEFQIEMAVHEAVANAIRHGNKENPSKTVQVKFLIYDDQLEIHVRDQGTGFDPDSLPDAVAKENLLNVSGRGIFIVRKFMDEFRVERSMDSGTEVVMIKHIIPKTQPNLRRNKP